MYIVHDIKWKSIHKLCNKINMNQQNKGWDALRLWVNTLQLARETILLLLFFWKLEQLVFVFFF